MSTREITYVILFSVPFYISLICGLLHLRMFLMKDSVLGSKPILLAVLAFMTSAFGWLSAIFYFTVPSLFVFLNPFLLLAFMGIHVVYYHFIFEMTKMHGEEKFPVIHYFIPVFLSACMLIWSLFIPFEVRLSLTGSNDLYIEKYKLYSVFLSSTPFLFVVWNIIYAVFGLHRIIQFRKVLVDYSADEQRTSFTWLYQFLWAMLAALPIAVVAICLPKGQTIPFWLIILFVILLIFKDIIFAHNVLLDNFVLIRPENGEYQNHNMASDTIKRGDIKRLETYIRKNKPYLNPKLKITDMTRELATNRTSLSLLINRTYGMNFSRYINRFRMEELERIKNNPAYADLSEVEKAILAGFSDYRGYKRVRQREETFNSN